MLKKVIINGALFLVTVAIGLLALEGLLRIKNLDQKNYNIEMWRYARLLKVESDNLALGHVHLPNQRAKLQGVEIRINSLGMRGAEADLSDPRKKKILFLGSSNTLGWGVSEEQTFPAILQRKLQDQSVILNGGIGNYNASRYVELFEKNFLNIQPDIVVVNCFIRDAEILESGRGNFLLRHSELAVMLFHLARQATAGSAGIESLKAYYRKVYRAESPGLQEMRAAFERLFLLSQQRGFKVFFTVIPDVHQMRPYPFVFANDEMRRIALKHGWPFLDFTTALSQVPAAELWAMPGDPHLNRKGHEIMAKELLPYLEEQIL